MLSAVCYTDYGQDPYEAMAFDEWLLSRVLSEPDLVAIRLYTWERGTITFGLNQRLEKAVDRSRLGETPLIRRITGGRALYHEPSELTYAIAARAVILEGEESGRSVDRAVRQIAEALSSFLGHQDIESEYVRQSSARSVRPDYFHTAPCFDSRARYELVTGDRKIVASAQRRLGPAMLQHGAIKLAGIARHPALEAKVKQIDQFPRLSAKRFSSLVSSFVGTVGTALGVRIDLVELTTGQKDAISRATEYVRKNALSRRNIVKQ
ncbi:MAG: hypothetical protein KOO62_09650 [candidate division Zixibacteria bacterium]|nr:hypothetical protein [candidate division Zixibacteria bacterium]